MKHSITRFVLVLLAFSVSFPGDLRAASSPESVITVQDAVAKTLRENPNLKNFREKVTEADANIGLAIAQVFPTISAIGTAAYQKDPANQANALFDGTPYDNYNAQIKATQPLYDGGAILAGLGFAKKQKQLNNYDVETNERDTTLVVLTDFYGTLYNQRLLDTLHRTRDAIEESVRTTDRFYKNGRSQLTDLLQIKTTLALLQPQITQAETAILTNASHLNYDMGSQNRRNLNLTSDFYTPSPEIIHDKIAHPMIRPEIEKIHLQLDQFQDTRSIALATSYPNFSAFATLGRSSYAKSDLLNDYSDSWQLGLQLTIPLFSGLSYYRQRNVLASQEYELRFQQDDLNNQMNYNEVNAENAFDSSVSVLKSSEEAFKLADAALKESQKNYRLQTINMLTLVTIEQNYLAASSAYDNSKYQYILAAGALFVAKGVPLSQFVALLR